MWNHSRSVDPFRGDSELGRQRCDPIGQRAVSHERQLQVRMVVEQPGGGSDEFEGLLAVGEAADGQEQRGADGESQPGPAAARSAGTNRSTSTPMLTTAIRAGVRPAVRIRSTRSWLTAITVSARAMLRRVARRTPGLARLATSPPCAVTTHGTRAVAAAIAAIDPVGNR